MGKEMRQGDRFWLKKRLLLVFFKAFFEDEVFVFFEELEGLDTRGFNPSPGVAHQQKHIRSIRRA